MQTLQERLLALVECRVLAHGLELARADDAVNVGHVFLYVPNHPVAFGVIRYEFYPEDYILAHIPVVNGVPTVLKHHELEAHSRSYTQATFFWDRLERVLDVAAQSLVRRPESVSKIPNQAHRETAPAV